MPKISKVGKFRLTAAKESKALTVTGSNETLTTANPTSDREHDAEHDNEQGLSRGQKKRQAKKDQYLKRQKLVLATLQLQKQLDQKNRIDGLDALKEALQATLKEQNSDSKKLSPLSSQPQPKTNKSKKALTIREVSHLGLVLEHPAFQLNPFATIQEHLKNTLATQAKELETEGKEKAFEKAKLEQQRKQVKKARLRESGGKHRKKFRVTRTRGASRK